MQQELLLFTEPKYITKQLATIYDPEILQSMEPEEILHMIAWDGTVNYMIPEIIESEEQVNRVRQADLFVSMEFGNLNKERVFSVNPYLFMVVQHYS